MLKKFFNKSKITFRITTVSPLLIRAGESRDEFNPTLPDIQCIRSYKNGEQIPIIPGSSLKGVFRSNAERIIDSLGLKDNAPCDIFNRYNNCSAKIHNALGNNRMASAKDKYIHSCPACRLFGNLSLKSRINFVDSYAAHFTIGTRTNVGINRVTGSSEQAALFSPEVVEYGEFVSEITLNNFFLWQLKLIFTVIQDINEGFISLGSSSTRGFGRVRVDVDNIKIKKPSETEHPQSIDYTYEEILERLKNVDIATEVGKVEFDEYKAL